MLIPSTLLSRIESASTFSYSEMQDSFQIEIEQVQPSTFYFRGNLNDIYYYGIWHLENNKYIFFVPNKYSTSMEMMNGVLYPILYSLLATDFTLDANNVITAKYALYDEYVKNVKNGKRAEWIDFIENFLRHIEKEQRTARPDNC